MSGLRLAIFDMDGTLMDSQEFIIRAMRAAFAEFQMAAPPRADILSIVGLSLYEAVERLVPDQPSGQIGKLAEAYKTCFVRQRAETGGEAHGIAQAIDDMQLAVAFASHQHVEGVRAEIDGGDLAGIRFRDRHLGRAWHRVQMVVTTAASSSPEASSRLRYDRPAPRRRSGCTGARL